MLMTIPLDSFINSKTEAVHRVIEKTGVEASSGALLKYASGDRKCPT